MTTPRAETARLLAAAAELKAAGASWEAVAAKVGRSPDTCRRWPALYPDEWRRLFRAAEQQLIIEAGAEAVLVLRALLRAEDDKVRRDVARTLVALRSQLRELEAKAAATAPTDDRGRCAEYLEGMDDAAVGAITDELRPAAEPGRGAGPAAGGGAAGPG
jgi:hypothetical protein